MRHATTRHWIAALRYLIDANDAPPEAQAAAKHALKAHARATTLHDDEQHAAHTALQTLRTLERETPRRAAQQVGAGKNVNLAKALTELEEARQESSNAQARVLVAKQIRATFTAQVEGACLNQHQEDLVRWVAMRRNADPTRCGEIETLPEQVKVIYSKFSPTWWNQWDDALTLDGISTLPLIYEPTWASELRASLAWVWEQVARGEYEKIPHPRATNPNTAARVYVPTRRAITLPRVPAPVKPTPTRKATS